MREKTFQGEEKRKLSIFYRYAFYDIATSSPLYDIHRNFYETSHGKSVCDGLGATVKCNVGQGVIRAKTVVSDARSFMIIASII